MANRDIITVLGATGTQGGGVVRAILDDPRRAFDVRGLTRDASSDKAKKLAALGAEVVEGDINDVESLKRVFNGAYGAYCVTFFREHRSPEQEIAQAGNMAKAARQTGLRHVIWSTLEDTRRWVPLSDDRMPTLMGGYKVPHYDGKGEANQHFIERDVPTTFLLPSFYWENMITHGMGPKQESSGDLVLTLPIGDGKLPGIAADDIGRCAYGILQQGDRHIGRTVGIAGEHLTGGQMAAALTTALGRNVLYNPVSPETYRGFGFPGADALGSMFQFIRDFNDDYCRARDPDQARALNPALQTFEQWLARNRDRIPIE